MDGTADVLAGVAQVNETIRTQYARRPIIAARPAMGPTMSLATDVATAQAASLFIAVADQRHGWRLKAGLSESLINHRQFFRNIYII
jgi:hypothetical protein